MTTTAGAPKTGRRRDQSAVVALVVASVLLVASLVMTLGGVFGPAPWQSTTTRQGSIGAGPWPQGGMMGGQWSGGMWGAGGGMMAGQIWLAGNGQQVTTITQARARAAQAGTARTLHPGEVIQFSSNFYVELKDSTGAATTEILVDPGSGAVQTEPGPAMMWNTGLRTGVVSQDQARVAASMWLTANRPGETVKTIDAYPGYYTVDTQVNGTIAGMLSVNATTGAVWYHTWHGAFVAMEDG
jgi:hypothetical protein